MKIKLILIILTFPILSYSQEDLMSMLDDNPTAKEIITSAFKSSKIVIGQSVVNPSSGVLEFAIEHNFGKLNQGSYNLWGLDQSTVRLGFVYGVNENLAIGIGRSSYEKTYDANFKLKLLKQQRGKKNIPVSVSLYSGTELKTLKFPDDGVDYKFKHRLNYVTQFLFARKFSNSLSLQLTPSYIHRNLKSLNTEKNDVFSLGLGGRIKLSNRLTLNFEYFHLFNSQVSDEVVSPLSIGFDIDTGGHIFQLRLSNSQPMFDSGFLINTVDKWKEGGIFLGFTINRVFTIVKPKY